MRLFPLRNRRRSPPRHPHGHEVVLLHGDLDVRCAAATGTRLVRLIHTGPGVLEVDLADVRHLSPTGCAALFTALRAARAHGTRLVLTHPNEQVRVVLRQIGPTWALTEGNGDAE